MARSTEDAAGPVRPAANNLKPLRRFLPLLMAYRPPIVLAIPAFLILPIITFALAQLLSWLVMLVSIAGKLIIFPVLALLAVVVMAVVYLLLNAIFTNK